MIPSPLLVVTDRLGSARPLIETIQAVLEGGARWIWFREKDLEPGVRRDLALELLALVRAADGRLTIGGDVDLAAEIGAAGVQLGAEKLDIAPKQADDSADRVLKSAPPSNGAAGAIRGRSADVGPAALDRFAALATTNAASRPTVEAVAPPLIGVSAHSLTDVRRAAEAGADYVTLSPIFSSASKPGYGPALGLDALHQAAAIGPPVIALGGIAPEQAAVCRQAGAEGIAVMGAIMRAVDPTRETRRFLRALRPVT